MRKVFSKIKKVFRMIGIFIFSIWTKVLAFSDINSIQADYGVRTPQPKGTEYIIGNIIRFFIIPLAFIIGATIYFKKSKSSTKRKIIISVIAFFLVYLIYIGIGYMVFVFNKGI